MGRGADEMVLDTVGRKSKSKNRNDTKNEAPWGDLSGIDFDKSFLQKLKKTQSDKTEEPKEAISRIWEDIGPVKNPRNITGNHKASAVWLGELDGKRVIVKLPGARITKRGELYLSGSATPGVMAGHDTTPSRSVHAEVLVDELLAIAGKDWQECFASVKTMKIEEGWMTGQEVLLVDYIDGEELPASYARDVPGPAATPLGMSEEENAYRRKAWENLWSADPRQRQKIAEDGRRILLIDLISMNQDRHLGNMMLSDGHLRAYDQGMAFGKEYEQRGCKFETHIILESGGMNLRDDERELLEKILKSNWLDRVENQVGKKSREAIESRISWMLKEGKLYSAKTQMVF